jgi:hypothetical protein
MRIHPDCNDEKTREKKDDGGEKKDDGGEKKDDGATWLTRYITKRIAVQF